MGESDIGLAAGNEKDPAQQLELLKKWEQQYPDSALKNQRTIMVAKAFLDVTEAAYGTTSPSVLAAGQKAAQQLEDHFAEYFDDSVKPASATSDQWAAARRIAEMQVHLVLAQHLDARWGRASLSRARLSNEAACSDFRTCRPPPAFAPLLAVVYRVAV